MKNIIKIAKRQGFTLLEILLVVAAIGILAGIVILAINPGKQLGDTRNAQRRVDVNTLLNAVYQYSLDNNGNFPGAIDNSTTTIQVLGTAVSGCNCTATTTVTSTFACADISSSLVPTYLVDIPRDPKTGSSTNANYFINKRGDGRIMVGSCSPEQSATINVTR
ncbi:MAG: prepilin-type N-terminal cleavage/methylation domain-containing protein [bacterium]|nr:prepilin-type N-terminal cleavage/methylation domain-containing protein [bacterium]